MSKIIGIDASTLNIGWSIMDYNTEQLQASGVIHLPNKMSFYERLQIGPRQLKKRLIEAGIDNVTKIIIEQPFFTNSPFIGKEISYMVGACLCILAPFCIDVFEVAAGQWYLAFTGMSKPQTKKIPKPADKMIAIKGPVIKTANELYGLNLDIFEHNDQADAIGMAKAYCLMAKSDYFDLQDKKKAIIRKKKNEKMAQNKAAKTGKPIKGELPL